MSSSLRLRRCFATTLGLTCGLGILPYDGPRWYCRASCEFFLEVGIATWRDFKLSYQASAHRTAKDLATRLKTLKQLWEQVGESKEGCDWAQSRKNKEGKASPEHVTKTAMLALIGGWAESRTSSMEDIPWNGPVQCKPSPCSEMVDESYVFHDVMWKQPLLNRASLLCLNLIARNCLLYTSPSPRDS